MHIEYITCRQATLETPLPAGNPNGTEPEKAPGVNSRTNQHSLLKQAEKEKAPGLILKVAYMVFKSAAHLNFQTLTAYLIDYGVLEEAKKEEETAELFSKLLESRDTAALEAMLKSSNAASNIPKIFQQALSQKLSDSSKEDARYLLDILIRNKPDVLYEIGKGTCKTLLDLCILENSGVDPEGPLASSIPSETYKEAYPNENARRALLVHILKKRDESVFDAVHQKVKFEPREILYALCEAMPEIAFRYTGFTFEKKLIPGIVKDQPGYETVKKIIESCGHDQDNFAVEVIRHWKPSNEAEIITLIRHAASQGMTSTVESLARIASEFPDLRQSGGKLFHAVLQAGDNEDLQALIDGGLELDMREKESIMKTFKLSESAERILCEGKPDIDGAIENGNIERVLQHAKRAKSANQNDRLDQWLIHAATHGRMQIVETLYHNGGCFEGRDINVIVRTLIALSARPYCGFTKRLIEEAGKKAPGVFNISRVQSLITYSGETPLVMAVHHGNSSMVKAILENADTAASDKGIKQALPYAIRGKHLDVIGILFNHCQPAFDDAKVLLKLAIENADERITDFVARKLAGVLSNTTDLNAAFEYLIENTNTKLFAARVSTLIAAGLGFSEQQIAYLHSLLPREEQTPAPGYKRYKRPEAATMTGTFEMEKSFHSW